MDIVLKQIQKRLRHDTCSYYLEIPDFGRVAISITKDEFDSLINLSDKWQNVSTKEEFNYQKNSNYLYNVFALDVLYLLDEKVVEYINKIKHERIDFEIDRCNRIADEAISSMLVRIKSKDLIQSLTGKELYKCDIESGYHYDYDYLIFSDVENPPIEDEDNLRSVESIIFDPLNKEYFGCYKKFYVEGNFHEYYDI